MRRSPAGFPTLAVLLLLLLSACASRAASSGDSGIRGVVLLGPMCPVESTRSPCPDRPLGDALVRILRDGDVVSEVRSDGDGRFTVALDPGSYVLQAVTKKGGPGMFAKPLDVTVPSKGFVDVTVTVDTGIR
jgi:hypothetical protein